MKLEIYRWSSSKNPCARLQEKEFERLGGTRTIPVNVRLVAATNRDLAQMVADKQFRSDLYYRLRVFPIMLPPLRERREDIPLLVNYFVDKHSRRLYRKIESVPADTMRALTRWDWPGNIRELENFLERAVILTKGPVLHAPLSELEHTETEFQPQDASLESKEREHILRVLRECKGKIAGPDGAAARLGLIRTTLNSKLKKLSIERRRLYLVKLTANRQFGSSSPARFLPKHVTDTIYPIAFINLS